jgi:hypothetical protein
VPFVLAFSAVAVGCGGGSSSPGKLQADGSADTSGDDAGQGDATSDAGNVVPNDGEAGTQPDAGGPSSDGGGSPPDAGGPSPDAQTPAPDGSAGTCSDAGGPAGTYDQTVLCEHPVAYWALTAASGTEADLTGNGNAGTYKGGKPGTAMLPNGDTVADFNGSTQYLTVPSNPSLSIPTTGNLTWEGWIRPDVLQFPNNSNSYIDWMGKCASYGPTCEWEARMYNTTNPQGRCNRLSAYVFNPSAGLGSAADWQPVCGLIQAGSWYHVVGEYTTHTQPADCPNVPASPGSIDVWVNGVPWNQTSHNPTGCMSQYNVVPKANNSPVNIGTMALDAWFQGAIGKVAVYDYLLTQAQITEHYTQMTGKQPTGSCAATCTL